MPTKPSSFFPGGPDQRKNAEPRWSLVEQPRVHGMATMEWNVTTGCTWFSDEWVNIVQCAYDPTIPSNQEWWAERVHPEDMPLLQRAVLAVHVGFVDRYEVTCRLKRPDGSWRLMLFRSQVSEKTPDGAPHILSGVCVDLTDILSEGYEVPHTLSISGLDYHSMLENSPDLFVRFSRDLASVYANPAVSTFLGGTRLSLAFSEKQVNRRLAGDYRDLFRKNVERVFREKAAVRDEMTLAMTDGSAVIGDCSFWPEFDTDGRVRYAMVQFRDITDKRLTEEKAALNEKRLEAMHRLTMMENADEESVLSFVMQSMLEIARSRSGFFFIPEEDGADRGRLYWSVDHYQDLDKQYLPDDCLPPDLIVQLTDDDGRRVYRAINNNRSGKPLYIVFGGQMEVMRGITAPVTEGNAVVCVAGVCNKDSDYSESDLQQFETFINSAWLILRRRRFVRELEKAKESAELANTAKNAFLANVSHELRTPLNGVLSMLQLIDALPILAEGREYLQTAQASGKALLRIISDILDFSGMESGKMSLAVDVFNFQTSVRSALNIFKDTAAIKGLAYTFTIDPAIPHVLLGDEARVRQVLFNLVGNALKFTPEGEVTVVCALSDALPDRVHVSVTVTDTGIGIPHDKLEGIFDAFSQVENSHRRKYAGTGLGLSIVKHLVSMMQGSVSIQSELGKGSSVSATLSFDLPASPRKDIPRASPVVVVAVEPMDILVVEDDSIGSVAIRVFLQRRGHRVVCVEDGGKALEALQAHPFHCVFTDITMPVMDGLELVQRIRTRDAEGFPPSDRVRELIRKTFQNAAEGGVAMNPAMPVVAVSAHSMIGDKERFLEHGMDYYISKPIDKDELDNALAVAAGRLKGRH